MISARQFQLVAILASMTAFSSAFAQDYVPGEVIVKLKGKYSGVTVSQFMGKVQDKMALKGSFGELNMHRLSLKTGDSVESAIAQLKSDPDVQYAEPNFILRKSDDNLDSSPVMSLSDVQAQMQAGDTYTQSWANTGVEQAWTIEKTLAQQSWKPIVAVIDTGVDYNHEIFVNSGAMWRNAGEIPNNGIDDDGNGYVDDYYGYDFHNRDGQPMDDDEHGTHVAGIILGIGQDIFANTLEPAKVRIMALKFLGADGSGTTSAAISAIYYAVRNGANVINNSWGGASYSQSLHDALTYAYQNNVTIASAAGNGYGKNLDSYNMFPASYPVPGQLAVAATTDSDNLASFSNYGANTVHVAAPGSYILSSVPGNAYRYMSGTSMATPFVSGMAALILREAHNLSGYQVRELIKNTSTYVSSLNNKVISHGRVDVYDSIQAAISQSATTSYQPSYSPEARGLASESSSSSSSGPKGCGTVGALGTGGGMGSGGAVAMALAFTLLPLLIWQFVRARSENTDKGRRRYDRFKMASDIRLNVGGRDLVGHMKTISEGGLSFNADTMLEKGGILSIQIQSPDGKETVQVQGHIVWCEKNQAYGVQFDEAKEGVRSMIRQWTSKLVKAV